jgi:ABC-type cobalamin/Fe3+-siderophores transport system ATPase subunit
MSKENEPQVLIEGSPVDALRDFFNLGKVRRIFRVGAEVFSAAAPFIEKPTPLNGAKAAFLVGKIIVEDMEVWPEDFFDEGWDSPYPEDFTKIILRALKGKPYKIIKTSDESILIHMVHMEDVQFGYIHNTKMDYVERIYVRIDKVERAKALIKAELWRQLKDDNIVLRQQKSQTPAYERTFSISLEADDAFRPMPSKRAGEYSKYLRKCIDAGVSRSVMLYGPPGTGKSTMARTIVDALGMKSFRIRVEDISHIDSSAIFEAINIFEPDAVILDDFDRSDMQAKLLETLEFFQRHVKLVVATVNNKNHLDEAILRPGRFDELVQIKQMDEDVVRAVLGDEHRGDFELLKDWPIAFIQEYVKRLRFMSPEEAKASTQELASRVKRLSKYEDDEDEVSIDKMITHGSRPPTLLVEEGELIPSKTFEDAFRKSKKINKRLGKPKKSLRTLLRERM